MPSVVSAVAAAALTLVLAFTAAAEGPAGSASPARPDPEAATETRDTPASAPAEPTPGGAPADFRGSSRHGGPPPVEVLGEQAERLGLDAKTRDAVHGIIKDSRAEADRLHERVGDAREEMRRLLSRPDIEEPEVMRQADAIGALEIEEHKNWLRAMLRIRGLLTPEQRAELVRMREEMFAQVFAGSRAACSGDIGRLCPGMHGDEETRACMRRHRDDLSDTCRDAIAAEFAKRRRNF